MSNFSSSFCSVGKEQALKQLLGGCRRDRWGHIGIYRDIYGDIGGDIGIYTYVHIWVLGTYRPTVDYQMQKNKENEMDASIF